MEKKQKRKFKIGDTLIRIQPVWNDAPLECPWYHPGQLMKITAITAQQYRYEYLNQPKHPRGNASFEEIETTCVKFKKGDKILKAIKVLYGQA
jgi:hypothetical protein